MSSNSIRWAFQFSKWNPTFSEMLLASSCIQVEEKNRLSRFVFKKDVISSLIGLLMMRKFVCEASGKPYNEIKFVRDERGKPCLADDTVKLKFNVSHHGDFVVCVGELGDLSLGVDIMKIEYTGGKTLSEFFRIMDRQFSPQEWIAIKSVNNERKQIAMFCRHWCLKESYVKAIGVGITVNLQELNFKIKSEFQENQIIDDTELFVKSDKKEWKFHESLVDSDHCVSVAIDNHYTHKIPFTRITFEQLIHGYIPLLQDDDSFVKQYFEKLDK